MKITYFVALRRMAEIISNSAILPTIRPWRRAYGGAKLRPRVQKMAEFGMKSAIVKSGPMPTRELPHYWMPEQVRQILATMPAGQPWPPCPPASPGFSPC